MSDSDNTKEPSGTPQEERQAPQEEQAPVPTSAKAKRKPRQPKEPKQPKENKKKSKAISVDVGHTEYFDDPKFKPLFKEDDDFCFNCCLVVGLLSLVECLLFFSDFLEDDFNMHGWRLTLLLLLLLL